jgi:lysophospholipase L1-like esterase
MHVFDITEGLSRGLTTDGLHPTTEGHAILGRNLAEKLGGILGYPAS